MAKNLPIDEPAGPEPGELDNRLSLTPSQFPAVKGWKDGETYELSDLGEGVKLRQISPGEFEVVPPPGGTVAGEEEDEEATPAAPAAKTPLRPGKRAVTSMMEE